MDASDTDPSGAAPSGSDAPRVSCVVIFLNEERFLGEAVASVLGQTLTDWELLLVDDGSTDDSADFARSLEAAHPGKIRHLRHEGGANLGKSASRNLGLRHAKADFVAFLDGDDAWLPDKLERQIALFERFPQAHMVCGATLYWHSWNPKSGERDVIRHTGETRQGQVLALDRLYQPRSLVADFYPIGSGNTTSQSGYMIRREFALTLGGFETDFRMLFEDLLFLTKIFFEGAVYVSSECFDKYRQHSLSSSQMASRREWGDTKVRYLEWLQEYLRSNGFSDKQVFRKARMQILRYRYPRLYRFSNAVQSRLCHRAWRR